MGWGPKTSTLSSMNRAHRKRDGEAGIGVVGKATAEGSSSACSKQAQVQLLALSGSTLLIVTGTCGVNHRMTFSDEIF